MEFPKLSCVTIFAHPANITEGSGRILYGTETRTSDGALIPAGWVLPGGRRTQDREIAVRAAQWIDQNSRAAK